MPDVGPFTGFSTKRLASKKITDKLPYSDMPCGTVRLLLKGLSSRDHSRTAKGLAPGSQSQNLKPTVRGQCYPSWTDQQDAHEFKDSETQINC